ncbi:MAG: hypothetical protein IT446_10260 [Phycisphaerales bacterium]|nr:hypothetical protein [Phycisphaerales bacterium]
MGHRILFVVLLAMALAGCQGGGSGPSTSAFKEVWIGDVGEYGESYELVKDITINGQLVKKGTLLRGKLMSGTKFAEGKWLISPEYTELVGRDQLIYGLRVGDKTFVRIDISTGRMKTEPTAFTSVHLLQFTPEMGYSEWDRWVGMTEGSQNVTLLDNKTGRPVTVFEGVAKVKPQLAIELLRTEGSLLVHHASYDRVYTADGTPTSPALFPLWIGHIFKYSPGMAPEVKYRIFAFVIDGKKKRYWPLRANGRVFPRPDDLLGLEPLYELDPADKRFKKWSGWLVWWKTPQGERCAHIPQEAPLTSYQAIMATRPQAKWLEYLTTYDSSRALFTDIRKEAGSNAYEVNRDRFPMTDRTFATVEEARVFIRSALAEERKQRDIQSAKAQAAWEAARLKAQQEKAEREAAELAAERQTAEAFFDDAMRRRDQPAARANLLKLDYDPQRWTQYVQTYGLDPADQNGYGSIGYARATQGGTDPEVLRKAVKAAKVQQPAAPDPGRIPLPQSDWDYFWNGPRDGNYSGPVSNMGHDPNLSIGGVRESQHQLDQRNMDAWMRGAQSWGGPR